MSRNLKSLGLALMGLLALTAVVASSASAKNLTSTSGSGTTYVTATGTVGQQLDLANGANVKCNHVVYEGSFAGTSTNDPILKPTYTNCAASGQTATITTGSCEVTLETATEIEPKNGDHFDGKAVLTGTGCVITVAVGDPVVACHVTVHPQTMTGVLDYTNITNATKDVTITSTLEVHYTASGSVCGGNGVGKLTGDLTAQGYSASTHSVASLVSLWLD